MPAAVQFRRFVPLACLGLAACGGDGGHVATSTPPPGSAPGYDSFATLNRDVSLATSSTAVSYGFDTHNGVQPPGVRRDATGAYGDGGVTIAYDAASQTYTLHDGTAATSYAPGDRLADPAGTDPTPFATFQRSTGNTGQVGTVVDTVRAYRPGGTDPRFPQLTYATFVVAQRETQTGQSGVSQATFSERLVYAIGGFETVRSDLPRTGTASYATFVTGTQVESRRDVGGTATLSADFGAGTVATGLALTSGGQAIGTFTGSAAIDGASPRFRGDLAANGATQGSFAGSFFGPQGTEAGYTYRVKTGIGTVDGGVVGKR